jgi:hypothetical protein
MPGFVSFGVRDDSSHPSVHWLGVDGCTNDWAAVFIVDGPLNQACTYVCGGKYRHTCLLRAQAKNDCREQQGN